MKSLLRPSLLKNLDSLLAAALGFWIIFLYTRHGGIGISPDSITYLSTARNMNIGKWPVVYDDMQLILFPVFYPTFLGSVMFITHTDAFLLGPVLNGVLFGLVIFLSGAIMEHFTFRSKWYKWIILLVIAFSPAMHDIFSMLWSETLFAVWVLLFFIVQKKYFAAHRISTLLWLAVIAALTCITRYAGVTLVATGGLLLLLDKQLPWKKKWLHIILFGAVGISLLTINLVVNARVTGMLTGMRQKSLTPLNKNIEYFGNVLCDWFTFLVNHYTFAFWIGLLLLIVFILVFLYRAFTFSQYYTYENISLAFFLVYGLFIIISSTLSRYEQINNRLLSPIYIPFLFTISYAIPRRIAQAGKTKWLQLTVAIVVAVLFLYNQLATDQLTYKNVSEGGIGGYTEDTWTQSPTVQFLQAHKEILSNDKTVYSNASHALYFLTGTGTETLPERVHDLEVKNFYTEDNFYIVWFNYEDNVDLLNLPEIGAKMKMDTIHTFPDGAIFFCRNKHH